MLLNPFMINTGPPAPVEGDLEIIYGNERHSTNYQGVVNYYYEYNYSCHFIEASRLTSIPDNAKIYKIQFQVDNSTTGTYPESAIDMWMGSTLSSYTEFPLNLMVNLNSVTDGTWNNQIQSLGKTKVISNGTRVYEQDTPDPDINRWIDLEFDFNFNYTAGTNLCYTFRSNSGLWTPGSSNNPKHKGDNLSGTQPRHWATGQSIGTPFQDITPVNIDGTFRPNVKIFWN